MPLFGQFFGSRDRPVQIEDAEDVKPPIDSSLEDFPVSVEFEGRYLKFTVKKITKISTIFANYVRRQNMKTKHLRVVDEDGTRLDMVCCFDSYFILRCPQGLL